MTDDILKWQKMREQNLATLILKNNYEKINFFESDGDLTFIVLDDGSRVRIDTFLHQLEKTLPVNIFFRCGWSFLVNINKVREYWVLEYPFLVMSNGEVIPVPQIDKEKIKKLLSQNTDIVCE